MLLISCFVLFIAELKNTVLPLAPPNDEVNVKLSIDLPLKTRTICPASYSKSLLFVSTVDGTLTCLNAKSGEKVWSFDLNDPLLSSTINPYKSEDVWSQSQIVPSLDGTLYKWNGKHVESLSMSTEFLLGQMKKLPDGSFVVGGTNVAIYGIDVETGQILYESSGRGCKPVRKGKINDKEVITLRRSQHKVRAVERSTGHENWNYSVGRYEIELADDDLVNIETLCDNEAVSFHFSVQDGIIQNKGTTPWSFKFKTPIIDAWRLDNKSLKIVDIFKHGLFESMQELSDDQKQFFMYLGVHEGQMYIQKAVDVKYNSPKRHSHPKTLQIDVDLSEWRPYVSTPSRTPTLSNKKRSTALSTVDYPYDNGYVLVSNITPTSLSLIEDKNKVNEDDIEILEGVMLKDRWKEILILSILIAVGINLGVKYLNKKFRGNSKKEPLPIEDNRPPKEIISSDITDSKQKRERYISSKIDQIFNGSENHSSFSTSYDSRYMDDFEHHECLGKGGFGVVFRATKKIDDYEYAIKRIYLPRCDEAKAKMMREVRALAALDHPNIVRYFHAWWEEPPEDWQKTTDKQYLMKDMNSTSFALSHDWAMEVDRVSESLSQSISPRSSKEKKISDDPLGKRYNFDTGVESYTTDHSEFDLLKHNDVFYSDEDEPTYSGFVNDNQNEDSFDIVFESNGGNENHAHSCVDILNDSKNSQTNNSSDSDFSFEKGNSLFDESDIRIHVKSATSTSRRKKKIVGKCCAQKSVCLTQPPLFLYIQMQLCKQETLKDWLKSNVKDGIPLSEGMGVFMQIVDAVVYFHNLGLMHRDLKPANIMFSLDGHVKVGDFGLVTAITQPSVGGKYQGQSFGDENHTGQVGTQLYMSPEQILGKPYCHKVDIYSLGLILFELVCPFSTQMERMQVIYKLKQGTLIDKLWNTPQGELVQILTAEDPSRRPEAKEIKNHNLITEINNNITTTKESVLSLNDSGGVS